MDQHFEVIHDIQESVIKKEKIYYNFNDLNKHLSMYNDLIMLVNIRGLNANFTNLQLFIQRLETKPCLIVCTETRVLDYHNYFVLMGYKIYYNESKINICDGVVVYIKDNVDESTEIVEFGRLTVLNSAIRINYKVKIVISDIYRSHDLLKAELIFELNKFLKSKKKSKII